MTRTTPLLGTITPLAGNVTGTVGWSCQLCGWKPDNVLTWLQDTFEYARCHFSQTAQQSAISVDESGIIITLNIKKGAP